MSLADMCPFDSQVGGDDWEAWSRWCDVFTRDEWEIIGHLKDARRYYDVGAASVSARDRHACSADRQPYGSTMGVSLGSCLTAGGIANVRPAG